MKRTVFVLVLTVLAAVPAFAADSMFEIGIINTATAVINEAPATADHACRLDIAIEFWRAPQASANMVSPYLSSQEVTPASGQTAINNAISAWLTTEVTVRKAEGTCAP